MSQVTAPFEQFYDIDGDPLENGQIYVGTVGLSAQSNQVTVYYDESLTLTLPQPIRTIGGRPVNGNTPVNLFIAADSYSITVLNKNGSPITSSLEVSSPEKLAADGIGSLSSYFFPSVDDMKTRTTHGGTVVTLVAGYTVETQGYHSAGAPGAAPYLIKTTAQAAADGDDIDGYANHAITSTDLVAILQIPFGGQAYASQFGAVSDAFTVSATDSYPAIAAGVQYCADSGIAVFVWDGLYYTTQTVKYSTGLTIKGQGPIDCLNSLTRKDYGSAVISTADPVFEILTSDELPTWPQDTGSSANVGFEGIALYSQSTTSAKGIIVGSPTGALRNVTIDNVESRGYFVTVEIASAYTLFMTRLSFRGVGGGSGTRGVLFSGGEVTSGYLDGAAFYQLEVAIECQSGTFAGFTFNNIDTDGCNHIASVSGFISNPCLFRDIAAEHTITSDFILNNSSGVVGIDSFATVVGTTTDHRIRCLGAGRKVLRNTSVNSILVPSGKRAISQEGTGPVQILGDLDPRVALSKTATGDVKFDAALYSEPTPLAAANTGTQFSRRRHWSIRIGTTADERTVVLNLSRAMPLASDIIHNVSTAGGTSIGQFLLQTSSAGANFLDVTTANATMTKISDTIFEMSWTATHNNAVATLSTEDTIEVYRKDVGPT